MTECKTFTASANTFSTADTSGDSFNCRAYHLTAASKTPDPHCGHIKKVSSTCK
jgi:phage tail sheath gpL-like